MITYHVGDTREVVASLPDGSISLVASSPPFIALRSYLPADHEHKHAEIGSEPDPATFLDTLLGLTAEWGRVLAPWGSIAIELGDTYAGSQVADRPSKRAGEHFGGQRVLTTDGACHPAKPSAGWPRAKSLALIPQLYATSLAYGRNLLRTGVTPDEMLDVIDWWVTDGWSGPEAVTMARRWLRSVRNQESPRFEPWLVRNQIVWHRPNPAVGALGDKVRPSTSYITVATRSPKRWFDLDAVRTPFVAGNNGGAGGVSSLDGGTRMGARNAVRMMTHAGAPPLDCWFDEYDFHDTWTLTTQPSSLAHYAMWPARLAERLILMMCPAEVCAVCQTPRRRLVRAVRTVTNPQRASNAARSSDPGFGNEGHSTYETLGWSDCGHAAEGYVPGVVLDPFAGTGTTLAVADLHGRDAIGIDLDERNRDLYPRRRDECARALFDVRPQMDGQMGLFG